MNPLDLPLRVPEGSETLALLERIARAVEDTGNKSEEASRETTSAFQRMQERVRQTADTFNEVREAAASFAEGVNGVVEGLAAGSSETDRMARAQASLGLNFREAAEGAGGYVHQLEVATAAQTLAERGIRLTQAEINGLTRVAQNYARTSGKEFSEAMEMVTEVVTEGGEEMGKLDTALLRVADTARFTADDRLKALVDRAREIQPAARTATEELNALRGSLHALQVDFSTGFVEGLRRMNELGDSARGARDDVSDLNADVRALGGFLGETLSRAANGFRAVVAFLGLGVQTTLNSVGALGAALESVSRGNVRGAGAAASSYWRDAMTNGAAADIMAELRRSVDAVNAQAEGGGRGDGTTRDSARRADMVFSLGETQDAAAAERDRRARSARGGGGGGGEAATPTTALLTVSSSAVNDAIDRALALSAEHLRSNSSERLERELSGFADRTVARAVARGMRDAMDRAIEGRGADGSPNLAEEIRGITGVSREQAAQRFGTPDDLAVSGILRDRDVARERRALEQRADAQQSYTDFMRDMHTERANAARLEAEAVTMGFNAMGQAMAKHVFAFATGRESIEDALQGMLADTLTSVGQEAIVKGAMEFAEGAAMLAGIYTAPLAPGHFAAGAAFMGVGALAAAAGAALTPSSASPGSGASAAPAPRSQETFGRPANDNDNGGGRTVVNHYYAPVIGGRDALDSEVGQRMSRYQDAASSRQVRDRGDRSRRAA